MKRMQGYNILYPMGWDAFGAPAEQYAIKNHIHPKKAVEENITDERENVYLNPLIHDTRIDTEDRMAETADLEITDIAEQGAMEESTRNSVKSEVAETMKSTLSDVSKRAQKKDTDNDKKHKLFTEFENKKRSQLRKTVQKVSKARDVR